MSEKQYYDSKSYLIAEGKYYRVWNNGIVEYFTVSFGHRKWKELQIYLLWEERLKFLKLWENAEINKRYYFDWYKLHPRSRRRMGKIFRI